MIRLLVILLGMFGIVYAEQLTITEVNTSVDEIVDGYAEQLICRNTHNVDIQHGEGVSLSVGQLSRRVLRSTHRMIFVPQVEHHLTTTLYPISFFFYRLGGGFRAIEYYLYTLCQLRI